MKIFVIGNLGSDAEVKNESGVKFVSFSVADTRRRKKENGEVVETTSWVSATINGDGGNLLPYLKKGTKVSIYGDGEVRQYHSEKERRLVAGVKVFVRDLEIISTYRDDVPRELYDRDGVAIRVAKYYYAADCAASELYDRNGNAFTVDKGWVAPYVAPATNDNGAPANAVDDTNAHGDAADVATVEDNKLSNGKKDNGKKGNGK